MIAKPVMTLIAARIGTLVVLTLAIPVVVWAQVPSNVSLDAPGFLIKKPPPGPPEVKAQPLAWPRLDPGATLCRSQADLERLAARRRGETVDGPIDCQIIRAPTAISIVGRNGPGRTEVKVSGSQAALPSGWTDAWLPDKGPAGSKSAAR